MGTAIHAREKVGEMIAQSEFERGLDSGAASDGLGHELAKVKGRR